mmetsp:Transcript_34644/g.101833  ORF Transcript_34644/g.101833 Transcript_34644/m.101833 type:complete len:176 (+) Transcript_34644:1227-1754(+)
MQRVEAQVRECSLVSSTNRGEVKRSDYIIQRSTNTSPTNRQANKTRDGRVLHANASVTAGIPGQRRSQSGEAEDPKKKTREQVRGEARTIVQLNIAKDRYLKLNRIQGLVQKQKTLVVGRIPYKALRATIKEHMDLLQAELEHRGVATALIPTGCRARVNKHCPNSSFLSVSEPI